MIPNEAGSGACNFGGVAFLSCAVGGCRAWVRRPDPIRLWAHELGHLTGLHHASVDYNDDGRIDPGIWGEYGDFSCPMASEASFKRYNAVHRYQNNWLTDANVHDVQLTSLGVDQAVTVAFSSASVVDAGSNAVAMVRVNGAAANRTYWLSYRTAPNASYKSYDTVSSQLR